MQKMKNRTSKEVQPCLDFYSSSDHCYSCVKHPNFASPGICPFCLRDRLLSLLCSDCGGQHRRLSNRRSCSSSVDIGSVGRISFLIKNEAQEPLPSLLSKDQIIKLNRSRSTHAEIKRSRSGFWKLSALFRKKQSSRQSRNGEDDDDDDDDDTGSWGCVSRSRSLCSFRGGWKGVIMGTSEEGGGGGSMSVSGGRSSSVTTFEAEQGLHSQRRSGRVVGGGFGVRELDLEVIGGGSAGFIDLDLDLDLDLEELRKQGSGAGLGEKTNKMERNGGVLDGEGLKGSKRRRSRMWNWIFGGMIM